MIFICAAGTRRAPRWAHCAGRADQDRPNRASGACRSARHDSSDNAATQLEAAARLSANFDRFNLGDRHQLQKAVSGMGPGPPGELNVGFIGTGHVGERAAARLDRASTFLRQRASRPRSCRPTGRLPTGSIGRAILPMTAEASRSREDHAHPASSKAWRSRLLAKRPATVRSLSASTSISRSIRGTASPFPAGRSRRRAWSMRPSFAISTIMAFTIPASRSRKAR